MLLLLDRLAILVLRGDDLLEIRGVAPGDLDGGGGLGDVREDAREEAVLLYLSHVVLDHLLDGVGTALLVLGCGHQVVHRVTASGQSRWTLTWGVLLIR